MSTFADAFASAEAVYRTAVMYDTWGHLYPPLGSRSEGFIEFVLACCGDQCAIVNYEFKGLPENGSLVLYDDCNEFVFNLYAGNHQNGRWNPRAKKLVPGLYRWEGWYKKFKNEGCRFQAVAPRLIYAFH